MYVLQLVLVIVNFRHRMSGAMILPIILLITFCVIIWESSNINLYYLL